MSESVAMLMVGGGKESELHYVPPGADAPLAGDAGEFRARLLVALNKRRTTAGLSPLRHVEAQSALSQSVTSHFFAASLSDDAKTEDLIALGLLAGHAVPGTIRTGNLVTAHLSTKLSPEGWLTHTLQSPMGRATLLAPQVRQFAIGTTVGGPVGGTGAIATTYAFFETDHATVVLQLHAMLAKARKARGNRPHNVRRDPYLQKQADRIASDGLHPELALKRAGDRLSWRLGRNVSVAYLLFNDLEGLEFPDGLLDPAGLSASFAVTHIKPPGAAWGMYVVLVTCTDYPMLRATAPEPTQRAADASCEAGKPCGSST